MGNPNNHKSNNTNPNTGEAVAKSNVRELGFNLPGLKPIETAFNITQQDLQAEFLRLISKYAPDCVNVLITTAQEGKKNIYTVTALFNANSNNGSVRSGKDSKPNFLIKPTVSDELAKFLNMAVGQKKHWKINHVNAGAGGSMYIVTLSLGKLIRMLFPNYAVDVKCTRIDSNGEGDTRLDKKGNNIFHIKNFIKNNKSHEGSIREAIYRMHGND